MYIILYVFRYLEDEVKYVGNKICELIESGINIDKIKCFNTSIIGRIVVKFYDNTEINVSRRRTNEIMKFLAGITIVFSIPTMIASFMGMNVPLGVLANNDYSFMFIMSISIFSAFVIALILKI